MRRALSWATALLVGSAVTVIATTATARAAGCPALDYQAGLVTAASALQRTPPDLPAAQKEVTALLAADGSSRVALQPVLSELFASPPDTTDAQTRLAAMSATLAYPTGSVCNENADAARSALHSVYASPDFRNLDASTQPGLLQTIFNGIANLLGRGAGALGPVGAVLLACAVVAVCLLLVWRRLRAAAGVGGAHAAEPATPGNDPDVEWRAAQAAAAAGDHREAVRRAFRSALLEVAVRSHVHMEAAWTTRELLRRLDAGGDVLAALAGAAALFERAWYSGAPVTRADWSRAEERCTTVRRLARRTAMVAQ